MQFKKPLLLAMPVLNIDKLKAKELNALSVAFDRLSKTELLPFSQIATDKTRAFIDWSISEAFGLPDLTPLREMIGREPIVTNRPLFIEEVEVERKAQMELLIK